MTTLLRMLAVVLVAVGLGMPVGALADPLPSWNDGAAKSAIVEFVEAVTTDGPDFVAQGERTATFDNDGTLWVEHPQFGPEWIMRFQLQFLFPK